MREIKFRTWYKTKKKMLYEDYLPSKDGEDGYFLSLSFDGKITVNTNDDGGKSGLWEHECNGWGEDFILMQYTGLKDKNNKDIYEGDIVVVEINDGGDNIETPRREDTFEGVIIWVDGRFSVDTKGDGRSEIDLFPATEFYICEVIGNIYQNPELLTQEQRRSDGS